MSARMVASSVLLALTMLLTGCGKKSAPAAPGPADQVIYPHQYPNPAIQQD
jgi:hypothetical protein